MAGFIEINQYHNQPLGAEQFKTQWTSKHQCGNFFYSLSLPYGLPKETSLITQLQTWLDSTK